MSDKHKMRFAATGGRGSHEAQEDLSSPLDMLLAGYVAGQLAPPLRALVAAHLALSPKSHDFVAALDALQAAHWQTTEEQPLRNAPFMLAALKAAIAEEADAVTTPANLSPAPAPKALLENCPADLPDVLAHYVAERLKSAHKSTLPWQSLLPGVKLCGLTDHKADADTDTRLRNDDERYDASLIWVGAGRHIPAHTHEGMEATLVLRGAFEDGNKLYQRGDIAFADSAVDHKPFVTREDDCICFVVRDAPLRLTGRFGRFFNRFLWH